MCKMKGVMQMKKDMRCLYDILQKKKKKVERGTEGT